LEERVKIIDIPKEVAKVNAKDGVKDVQIDLPFTQFLSEGCKMYKEFAVGPEKGRQYDKIMTAIESVNGDAVVRLEDADYEVLKDAFKNPQWRHPDINRAYTRAGYYKAIENAQDVKA